MISLSHNILFPRNHRSSSRCRASFQQARNLCVTTDAGLHGQRRVPAQQFQQLYAFDVERRVGGLGPRRTPPVRLCNGILFGRSSGSSGWPGPVSAQMPLCCLYSVFVMNQTGQLVLSLVVIFIIFAILPPQFHHADSFGAGGDTGLPVS